MPKWMRKFLEQNGLRAEATEQEAWDLYSKLRNDGVEINPPAGDGGGGDGGQRSAGAGAVPPAGDDPDNGRSGDGVQVTPEVTAMAEDLTRKALRADAQRRSAIEDNLRIAGLFDADNGEFTRTLLNNPDCSLEQARTAIFKKLKENNPALGSGTQSGFEMGADERDKFRAAAGDALLMRAGCRIEKPDAGARELRGYTLMDLARLSLEKAGVRTVGMSRMELAARAIAPGSTSDFPMLMSGVVNRRLIDAYQSWPQVWREFCAITSANDFRDMYAVKFSDAPDLKGLTENGEYQSATFSDSGEKYRLITKGIIVWLTRQMIINDDLRAFTRIPALFGASAARMVADMVWSLITTNPQMSDNYPVCSPSHNNLAAGGDVGLVSSTTLDKGRQAMRLQKGGTNAALNLVPYFLLVPVAQETASEILVRSAASVDDNKNSAVHNPWAGKLMPIADPHLDNDSLTAWYLLAHPNQAPVLEVAFLEGEEQPYVEETTEFKNDAVGIKVRHDAGAGVTDYAGIYKNPGA